MISSGYIMFNANIIQFGMDQLYDSPSEDSVLFIHWFVFTSHLAQAMVTIIVEVLLFIIIGMPLFYNIPVKSMAAFTSPMAPLIVIGISSWIIHKYKRHWFMIDQASRNPYKLVYKVIKFAVQHKTPIRRSAFTYCEDELPSRMDLGKNKYGGPFTTEQVEDVTAFLEILCVLLSMGPFSASDVAANKIMLLKISGHLYIPWNIRSTHYPTLLQ